MQLFREPRIYTSILLIGVLAGMTAHAVILRGRMPDPMATHFRSDGTPNGWSSASSFLATWLGIGWGIGGVLLTLSVVMPFCPDTAVNLPDKEVFISVPGSVTRLLKAISALLLVDTAAIVAVIWVIFALTAQANEVSPPFLPTAAIIGPVAAIIVAEMAFVGGILYLVYKERARIRRAEPNLVVVRTIEEPPPYSDSGSSRPPIVTSVI